MPEISERFDQLITSLSNGGSDNCFEGPTDQPQAILFPLVNRTIAGQALKAPPVIPADPNTCPNCGVGLQDKRSPYCSDKCREMAAFVRQFRAAVADGSIMEAEKQTMMGQKLWAVAVGGYPLRQTLVPPKVVAKVIERDGGKCTVCGAPATEIDHTGSG